MPAPFDLQEALRSATGRATIADPRNGGRPLFTTLNQGGTLSTTPVRSKIRIVADYHPAVANSVFASTTFATDASADLQAFNYNKGGPASAAGFGSLTTANERHTNVTTPGECPNGGESLVVGFKLKAEQIKKSIAYQTTAAGATDDSDGKVTYCSDNFRPGNPLSKFTLEQIAECYVPYVQVDGDKKEYLGRLEFKLEDGAFVAYLFHPEGWHWKKGTKLIFGLERKLDKRNVAWIDDYSGPFYMIASGLDIVLDGSITTSGEMNAIQDLVVETIGVRTSKGA
jgi:hypothetical protein